MTIPDVLRPYMGGKTRMINRAGLVPHGPRFIDTGMVMCLDLKVPSVWLIGRGVRAVEGGGLEKPLNLCGFRGFESHPLARIQLQPQTRQSEHSISAYNIWRVGRVG